MTAPRFAQRDCVRVTSGPHAGRFAMVASSRIADSRAVDPGMPIYRLFADPPGPGIIFATEAELEPTRMTPEEVADLPDSPTPRTPGPLAKLAAVSHADATRRGCYPQLPQDSLADILDEAEEAAYELRKGSREAFCEELVDVLLCTLSTMHDMGMDIDAEVAHKMAVNRTRGPRA